MEGENEWEMAGSCSVLVEAASLWADSIRDRDDFARSRQNREAKVMKTLTLFTKDMPDKEQGLFF